MAQNLNYGGLERLLADLVRRTDPARFENHVLTLQYVGRFGADLGTSARIHVAAPDRPGAMVWPRRLARQIADIAPDVVHSHSGLWFKASRAARMARVPWIIHTEHGRKYPDPLISKVIDGTAALSTDVVVAVSEVLETQLRRSVLPPWTRLELVRNGVDTSRFQPRKASGDLRAELGIPEGVHVIGSVGRLEPVKGYDVMVRAYARLRATGAMDPAPVLCLVGDGHCRPALEELAERLEVRDSVHFLGWRDDIERLHHDLSLFSLSSHSEGTSVSLLEAMSSGVCPVVTDVGGNRAVLGVGLSQCLVPPSDFAALANRWLRFLRDQETRCRAGRDARERVRSRFSLERMVARYAELYMSGGMPGR